MLTAVKELHFSALFEQTDLVESKEIRRCPHIFNEPSHASFLDSPKSEDDSHILWENAGIVIRKREVGTLQVSLSEGEHEDVRLLKLATEIDPLLLALPDNQLNSFR